MAKMRDDIKSNLEREVGGRVKAKTKDSVMNALIKSTELDVPKALVEQDVERLVQMTRQDMQQRGMDVKDMPFPPELFTAQAERRVRLGLVLAQAGESADIKVSDDEVNQALIARVRQFPGQEQQVWDFYRKTPQALAELRAPLFEEKVVDHVLGQVKLVEEPVSKEALFADEDDAEEAKADKAESADAAPAGESNPA